MIFIQKENYLYKTEQSPIRQTSYVLGGEKQMKMKSLKNDVSGVSAIKSVLMLVILDVIALALVPTVAESATSAAGNLTDNPSAQGMVSIVVIFYVIVIIVVNAVVVIKMVGEKSE